MLFDLLFLRRIKAFTVLLLDYALDFVCWYGAHLHAEEKDRALFVTLRVHLYMAIVLLDDRFTDHQTKTYTLLIRSAAMLVVLLLDKEWGRCATYGCANLPEALEEVLEILGSDPAARVTHVNYQLLLDVVVARVHPDEAACRELDRVLDQIDQNLLQADFVSLETGQAALILLSCFKKMQLLHWVFIRPL